MNKLAKLVILSAKKELSLSPIQKLKLAKKRIMVAVDIDEDKLEKIKKDTLTDKVSEMKEKVITQFDLLQDIKIKAGEDTKNETLEQELSNKESDLQFAVEDLVRAEKESNDDDMKAFDAKLKLAKGMEKETSKQVEDTKFKKNQKDTIELSSSIK